MKLYKLLSKSARFLTKHSSLILSVGAGVCTVGAVVTVADATTKTLTKTYDRKTEELLKIIERTKEQGREPDIPAILETTKNDEYKLTTKETIETWALPVLFTAGSLVCIIFNHKINMKKQTALIAAAASTASMFRVYRDKVIETYGEEADEKIIQEVTKADPRYFNYMDEFAHWDIRPDETITVYDENVGGYFETTPNRILIALYHFCRVIYTEGYITMSRIYEFLGVKPDYKHKDYCDKYGYSISDICDAMCSEWMDWKIDQKVLDDGMTIFEMVPDFDPVCLEGEWI